MASLLLALDQGTTNTKATLVGYDGKILFRAAEPISLQTPQPAWVEQDPLELWQSALAVLDRCAEFAARNSHSFEGIALSNQRETALAWRRSTGEPLAPAISWQCRRTQAITAGLACFASEIRGTTGLPLDPVLSATKWAWMLAHCQAVRKAADQSDLCLGTVDSWLLACLTGGKAHATDLTNASRTGLLDLAAGCWSEAMAEHFGIPISGLPELRDSASFFTECNTVPHLRGVPIVAVLGDSHAALAGHAAFHPGTVKATYGTGSSLMALTPTLAADEPELARTVAWSFGGRTAYALEGNIFMTGSGLQWTGEFLGLADPTASAAELAATVPNAAGLYFVPAMSGLGAPHWNSAARGLLSGLERTHTVGHFARAAFEAVAFQVADVFFVMQRYGASTLNELHADGGATRNRMLMQFQADILGVPVLRSMDEELSALGAAYLGGLVLGWWPSFEAIAALPRTTERFEPKISAAERERLYDGWRMAVRRATLEAA